MQRIIKSASADKSPVTTFREYILRPLDNVREARPHHLSGTGHSLMGAVQKSLSYGTWEEWFGIWRKLKSSVAMEELRAREYFYRCMSFDCPYATMVEKDFLDHLQAHHAGEGLFCSYCLQGLFNAESLIKHSRKHSTSGYQCPQCVYRASTPEHVLLHMKKYHHSYEVEKVWRCSWAALRVTVEVSDSHIQPFRCADCRFKTKNVEEFGIHQATHPSTSCFYCMMFTTSFNELLEHLKSHKIYDFHCYFCCFADDKPERIFNHIAIRHPDEPLVVGSRLDVTITNNRICTIPFSLSENTENETLLSLGGHEVSSIDDTTRPRAEKSSETEKLSSKDVTNRQSAASATAEQTCPTFVCPFCHNSHSSRKNLFTHITFLHHKSEIYFCYDCNKCFESQIILKKHNYDCHKTQAGTANEFVYLCVFCNFTSSVFSEMVDHMSAKFQGKGDKDSSKNEKNNKVESWIQSYLKSQKSSDSNVLRPAMVNEGVKGKTCPMCLSECASPKDCFEHICDHLQYWPYKCISCPQTFKSHVDALNHGVSQHPEQRKPFQCFSLTFVENWIAKLVYGESKCKWPVFQCNKCTFKNKNVKSLLKHFEKDHPDVPLDIRRLEKTETTKKHKKTPSEHNSNSLKTNVHQLQVGSTPNRQTSTPVCVDKQCNPEIETQDVFAPSSSISVSVTGDKPCNPETEIDENHSKIKEKTKHTSAARKKFTPHRTSGVTRHKQTPSSEHISKTNVHSLPQVGSTPDHQTSTPVCVNNQYNPEIQPQNVLAPNDGISVSLTAEKPCNPETATEENRSKIKENLKDTSVLRKKFTPHKTSSVTKVAESILSASIETQDVFAPSSSSEKQRNPETAIKEKLKPASVPRKKFTPRKTSGVTKVTECIPPPEIETEDVFASSNSVSGEKQCNSETALEENHSKIKEKLKPTSVPRKKFTSHKTSGVTKVAEIVLLPQTNVEDVNLKCSSCKYETLVLEVFKDHCKSQHNPKRLKKGHRQGERLKEPSKKVFSRETSSQHLSRHNDPVKSTKKAERYRCPLCNYLTSSVSKLSSHTKKNHCSGAEGTVPSSDHKMRRNKDEGTSKDSMSLARIKARRVLSESSSSSNESVPRRKKLKSFTSERETFSDGDSLSKSSSIRKKLKLSTSRNEDTERSGTPTESYWSNYGKKPRLENLESLYLYEKNAQGDGWERIPVKYRSDIFKRTIRVVLDAIYF